MHYLESLVPGGAAVRPFILQGPLAPAGSDLHRDDCGPPTLRPALLPAQDRCYGTGADDYQPAR
jgi:hypothetical protein